MVNKFLFAGYKFVPEMHLKQSGLYYSACGPFTKNKEIQNIFTEMDYLRLIFSIIWLMDILKI